MPIIGALPNTILNGQPIDAIPVMADFNWLMTQTNANAAANGANTDITSLASLVTVPPIVTSSSKPSFRQALINGNFTINQIPVSGTVTLGAGIYGHDGFKGGATGCTYTFAVSGGITTLTITAGTLVQVANGNFLQSSPYTLGWTGTSLGRIDLAVFGASPQAGTAVTGVNQSCEWGVGTLSLPQYEPGTIRTAFEFRDDELIRCRNYYRRGHLYFLTNGATGGGFGYRSEFGNPMNSSPTIAYSNTTFLNASLITTATSKATPKPGQRRPAACEAEGTA